MALADSIISAESGGRQDIGNARSTAYGPGQFLRGTWLQMIAKYRPDLLQDHNEAELLAMRRDPSLSRQMTNAYADENAARLQKAGFDATPGNTYLAHFAGPGGALNVLRADPAAPLGPILGDKVMAANPFLAKMTAGDLRSWADRKMGAPIPPAPIPLPPAAPETTPQLAAAPVATPRAQPGPPMAPQVPPAAQAALPASARPAQGMIPPDVMAQLVARSGAPAVNAQMGQPTAAPAAPPGPPAPAPAAGSDPAVAGMLDGLMRRILASPMGGDQAAIARQQSYGG